MTVSGSPSAIVVAKEKPKEEPKPTTQPKANTNKNTNNKTQDTKKKEEPKPKEEPKKSKNTYLSSMQIEGIELIPSFNKDITRYSIQINQDITSVNISANTEDTKSKYEVFGNKELKVGVNNIIVKVIAEDRQCKRVYHSSK